MKVTGLPTGLNVSTVLRKIAARPDDALLELLESDSAPAKAVTADPNRRMLTHGKMIAEYFTTTGTPVGHGYTKHNRDTDTAYYTFTKNGVVFISLDTVNRNGNDDGSLDQTQFEWLIDAAQREQLAPPRHHRQVGNGHAATTG